MNPDLIYQFLITLNTFLDAHPEIVLMLTIWILVWKGLALWKAAQRQEKAWFVVLLVLNTIGLLDILYLFVFSRDKKLLASIKEEDKDNEKEKNQIPRTKDQ